MTLRGAGKGQIMIPALLVFPSLFLFVLLLFDSGMLSREKIRRQFALDAAATIETDQYTDILNRIAYVNGAFPERIFKEFMGPYWQTAWAQGAFPAHPTRAAGQVPDAQSPTWGMKFGQGRESLNTPDLYYGSEQVPGLHINPNGAEANPLDQSLRTQWAYFKVYAKIELVAKQQWKVFEQTTLGKHSMVRESLRRNLCSEAAAAFDTRCQLPMDQFADEEAKPFITLKRKDHFMDISGLGTGWSHCPTWVTDALGNVYAGTLMPQGIPTLGSGKIFQLETVAPDQIKTMEKQGWEIKHGWTAHPTYFKVDFPVQPGTPSGSRAFVYGRVTITGGKVWPDPTPKFYTHLNACRFGSDCTGQ